MKSFAFWFQFHLKIFPKGPIVSGNARRRIGDRPLSETRLTMFPDAYTVEPLYNTVHYRRY